MSKVDPEAQKRAATKRTTGLPTEATNWTTPSASDGERGGTLTANMSGTSLTQQVNSISRQWATPDCNTSTYSNGKFGPNLRQQSADWPTPRATDGTKGGPNQAGSRGDLMLPSAAAQWPTPISTEWKNGCGKLGNRPAEKAAKAGMKLGEAVENWPTPASRDYRTPNSQESQESQESRQHTGGEQLPNYVEHHFLRPAHSIHDGPTSSPPAQVSPRRLNPAFGCWLMNWPWWWTNPGLTSSVKSEMALYRRKQQQLLSNFFDEQALPERKTA